MGAADACARRSEHHEEAMTGKEPNMNDEPNEKSNEPEQPTAPEPPKPEEAERPAPRIPPPFLEYLPGRRSIGDFCDD